MQAPYLPLDVMEAFVRERHSTRRFDDTRPGLARRIAVRLAALGRLVGSRGLRPAVKPA